MENLEDDLEWKLTYVGSAESASYDQVSQKGLSFWRNTREFMQFFVKYPDWKPAKSSERIFYLTSRSNKFFTKISD